MKISRIIGTATSAAALIAGAAALWFSTASPPSLERAGKLSTLVTDRNGKLLRPFTTPEGIWRLPVTSAEVDPKLLTYLKAYEDRRFDEHFGADPYAFMRAAWQAALYGRVVSGGSTLSMQTARLLEPERGRNLSRKIWEIGAAAALEREVGKQRVLDLYLTLAPYGGNLEGVRAASLAYFGKEPARLTTAQAALLVALPQSPEARRPDRDRVAAKRARNRVIDRLVGQGVIEPAEAEFAKSEDVPDGRKAFPAFAAHAAEGAIARAPDEKVIKLTIDREIQVALEGLALERARNLGPGHSMAIVAVDHKTGAVRAHVGSADYFDESRAGSVDQARAVRSPGSTLKPFIYGMAFEEGIGLPETLIEDRPTRFGGYAPKNFGEDFQGTVTMEKALQLSLNVPAVAVLDAVGPERLVTRLKDGGAQLKLPNGEAPGLAIGLGGVGTSLFDLATLYTGLARGGESIPLYEMGEKPEVEGRRLLDPVAAAQIAHALLGTPAPKSAVTGRIAYKTGTSYGFRDAWAVGFDGRTTVAVWTGRPDGASSPGLVGRDSAGPILFDAFARIAPRTEPLPPPPYEATLRLAELPPALKRFQPRGEPAPLLEAGDMPLTIAFPADGVRVDLGAGQGAPQALALKAAGGTAPFTWLVDGKPVTSDARRRDSFWTPEGRGFARLTVLDAAGRSASATVRID
ncbi:penicillin-binding protein 1C [Terrihabitans soli]|uniref:peptidoglycan glycosyltransferase n=1 Tax=Terrihabitans soli TaxID=708113 RepID=A0A6S6QR74_9HYPH|nr:penicillin-binding protein 1C [Terrihabitans soli]BCJ90245.1 penicillin-binding protein 1C [Terrihabitans soli]